MPNAHLVMGCRRCLADSDAGVSGNGGRVKIFDAVTCFGTCLSCQRFSVTRFGGPLSDAAAIAVAMAITA